MTYAEVEKRITECLQTPDAALVNIKPILEDLKADYESMICLTEKVEKQDTRIRDLQDTNMKLFLSQTGQAPKSEEDEEDELQGAEAIDAFVAKLKEE